MMVTVHGIAVKMYPEQFPGILIAALVCIWTPTVQKDMVALAKRVGLPLDGDITAAGEYDEE